MRDRKNSHNRPAVDHATTLRRRIATHRAKVAIIGQGYVGLPLAVEFAKAGFAVTGLDTDPDRVAALATGRSYVPDVPSEELQALLRAGRYRATTEPASLADSESPRILTSPTWWPPPRKPPATSARDNSSSSNPPLTPGPPRS